ncbi:MAG TPA: hypothetical protein DC063_12685 [Arenimonas sp.]|nr:hypothetical protein [Arenimonas sp.]
MRSWVSAQLTRPAKRQSSLSLNIRRCVVTHCSRRSAPASSRYSSLLAHCMPGSVRPPDTL